MDELECPATSQRDGCDLVFVLIEEFASGSCDFSKDSVDHAARFGTDVAFGPFDGFVDHGVWRKAVQEEELGRGADENGLHAWFDGFKSPSCELGDDVAEGDPAGDRFADDRMAQGTVAGLKVLDLRLDGHQVGK